MYDLQKSQTRKQHFFFSVRCFFFFRPLVVRLITQQQQLKHYFIQPDMRVNNIKYNLKHWILLIMKKKKFPHWTNLTFQWTSDQWVFFFLSCLQFQPHVHNNCIWKLITKTIKTIKMHSSSVNLLVKSVSYIVKG